MVPTEVVSAEEWNARREALLVREKDLTRARDAVAAERRRLPMVAVEKGYRFEGPDGERSLLELLEGRRQLIVYWPRLTAGYPFYDDYQARTAREIPAIVLSNGRKP